MLPCYTAGSCPHGRIPRPRPRCGSICQAVEEMGRIRVSRKRKVTTRMEEEKLNTEADYFESSETRQDDVCTEVSNDLFSNTDWYGRNVVLGMRRTLLKFQFYNLYYCKRMLNIEQWPNLYTDSVHPPKKLDSEVSVRTEEMVGIFTEGLGVGRVVRSGAHMVHFRHFSLLAMLALKALRVKQDSVTLQSERFKSRTTAHSTVSVKHTNLLLIWIHQPKHSQLHPVCCFPSTVSMWKIFI